jgi:hypothetical protein
MSFLLGDSVLALICELFLYSFSHAAKFVANGAASRMSDYVDSPSKSANHCLEMAASKHPTIPAIQPLCHDIYSCPFLNYVHCFQHQLQIGVSFYGLALDYYARLLVQALIFLDARMAFSVHNTNLKTF